MWKSARVINARPNIYTWNDGSFQEDCRHASLKMLDFNNEQKEIRESVTLLVNVLGTEKLDILYPIMNEIK